jgi:hypothetical protein
MIQMLLFSIIEVHMIVNYENTKYVIPHCWGSYDSKFWEN